MPVDLKILVDGIFVKEQFLWEASNTDSEVMRLFGLQILSEKLGRTAFYDLSPDTIRRFGQAVWEMISLNVNVYNRLNMAQFIGKSVTNRNSSQNAESALPEALTQSDLGSPIVKIHLRLHRESGELLEDSFFWDLTWDLNQPETFARTYWEDLGLDSTHEKQIIFAIRKQVFDHLKQVSLNKKFNFLKSLNLKVSKEMFREVTKKARDDYSEVSYDDLVAPK